MFGCGPAEFVPAGTLVVGRFFGRSTYDFGEEALVTVSQQIANARADSHRSPHFIIKIDSVASRSSKSGRRLSMAAF